MKKGQLFAFLGPNGSGKSTTIEMLCTLLKPNDGKIMLDGCFVGEDDNEIRFCIGVVFQGNLLDGLLTVFYFETSRPPVNALPVLSAFVWVIGGIIAAPIL